jgi:hypothetical protein
MEFSKNIAIFAHGGDTTYVLTMKVTTHATALPMPVAAAIFRDGFFVRLSHGYAELRCNSIIEKY